MCIVLSLLFVCSFCYRSVICIHGVGGSYHSFDGPIEWIQQYHPGTKVIALDFFNDYESYASFEYQIPYVVNLLRETREKHNIEDGYILLSHSQGSVITRAVIHLLETHGIGTWISLAGPMSGQYGIPNVNFPKEFEFLLDLTLEEVTEVLYLKVTQHLLSFADYWLCPLKNEEYLKKNLYLPIWNNETFNPTSIDFRKNFMKVKKMYFFASPIDKQIKPWQSEHWGFYEKSRNNTKLNQFITMEQQEFYEKDSFGLKSMNEEGRIILKTVPIVPHNDWVHVKEIFVNNVLPLLD